MSIISEIETKYGSLIWQFLRFVAVGVLNTLVNYLVLNILLYLTHITGGPKLILLSVIAFGVAVANSYFLNDYWVFKDMGDHEGGRKFSLFLTVSVIGAGINALVVYLITTYIHPMFGLSATMWVNAATLVATCFVLVSNFIGYKYFVFKK